MDLERKVLGLLFSRDRAMQLDATLRSFYTCCQDPDLLDLAVLYKATTLLHSKQYAGLQAAYPQVHFISQASFRHDVLDHLYQEPSGPLRFFRRLILSLGHRLGAANRLLPFAGPIPYGLFLVDDNLFVRRFNLEPVLLSLQSDPSALGFSLRLGSNTTFCYPQNRTQSLPPLEAFHSDGEIFRFNWTRADGDFGYPLEVSSSIYRLAELLPVLDRLQFTNPNRMESYLSHKAPLFSTSRPWLLCFGQSVTFCDPINKIHTDYANRAGSDPTYTADHLAELYEQGYRIDVNAYLGFIPSGCHQEEKLVFALQEAAR